LRPKSDNKIGLFVPQKQTSLLIAGQIAGQQRKVICELPNTVVTSAYCGPSHKSGLPPLLIQSQHRL
jgi:hypothetical protein